MTEPLLELRSVVKSFHKGGEEFRAVDGVDLLLYPHESVGLIGESGSGKSTVARIALMLLRPDSGTVLFDGRELTALSAREMRAVRSDLQVVFQEPFESLDPQWTVRQCVSEPLDVQRPRLARSERARLVTAALQQVGLGDFGDRYPAQLSGGQQQRVGIARAIVVRPKVIVLDEPTSSLDLSVRAEILQLLRELQADLGVAYLFITHDLATIERFSDRIIVMRHGRIVEEGSTSQIILSPAAAYTRALLDARLSVVPPAA
jgi:ABC-type microcin C transport system duplicated ATPase subunit YejF